VATRRIGRCPVRSCRDATQRREMQWLPVRVKMREPRRALSPPAHAGSRQRATASAARIRPTGAPMETEAVEPTPRASPEVALVSSRDASRHCARSRSALLREILRQFNQRTAYRGAMPRSPEPVLGRRYQGGHTIRQVVPQLASAKKTTAPEERRRISRWASAQKDPAERQFRWFAFLRLRAARAHGGQKIKSS
jgi:hypothetical protein